MTVFFGATAYEQVTIGRVEAFTICWKLEQVRYRRQSSETRAHLKRIALRHRILALSSDTSLSREATVRRHEALSLLWRRSCNLFGFKVRFQLQYLLVVAVR